MAERRMFAKTIIDSDAFLDMPLTTQSLYFHLSMRADDDGFINNPKKIQRMIGASDDDLKVLLAKRFLIPFESGIVVIKHWRIHNYIQKDRYKETVYQEEKSRLEVKDNNAYTLRDGDAVVAIEETSSATDMRKQAYEDSNLPYSFDYKIRNAFVGKPCPVCGCIMSHANNLVRPTIQHNVPISQGGKHELGNISVVCSSCNSSIRDKQTGDLNANEVIVVWDEMSCIQDASNMETQVRLGKDRLGKDRIESGAKRTSRAFTPPTFEEVKAYCEERKNGIDPQHFIDYYQARGWVLSNGKKMVDFKAAIRTWEQRNKKPEASGENELFKKAIKRMGGK